MVASTSFKGWRKKISCYLQMCIQNYRRRYSIKKLMKDNRKNLRIFGFTYVQNVRKY
jgi:hypothetical protein